MIGDNEQANMRVLIADDDEITRELLDDAIREVGYTTCLAEDGKAALEQVEVFQPDLIITDIEMPNMDGLELLRTVRESQSDIIIIVITAAGSEDYAIEALRHKANDYLQKPLITRELLRLLGKYASAIEERKADREIADMIVESRLTMKLANRMDLVYKIVNFLVAQTGNSFGQSDRLGIQLGLAEIITNAIEHGNLGITYEEKSAAMENGDGVTGLNILTEARLSDRELANRRVTIDFQLDDTGCEWNITDQGEGFDWRALPEEPEGEALLKQHGRGIFLSRFQFDELEYLDKGNMVRLKKSISQD